MSSINYPSSKAFAVIFFVGVFCLQAHNTLSAFRGFEFLNSGQTVSIGQQSPELREAAQLTNEVVRLYSQNKYEEALPLAKRVVELRGKILGVDDQLVRNANFNLAELYIALQKYGDAESSLEKVIKSYQKIEPDDVRLAGVLDRIALVHYARGDEDRSEAAYLKSLAIREKAFGADSSNVAQSVLLLAELYQSSGKYQKAAPYYQRLIAIREKNFKPDHGDDLADAFARYSCLLRKLGREEEADLWQGRTFDARVLSSSDAVITNKALLKGGVLNGKAISLEKPVYPEEARAARVAGTVMVQVVIDETGRVIRACAAHGPSQLWHTSEVAAYRSKFSPTKISGMPVKVTGVITYNYVAR